METGKIIQQFGVDYQLRLQPLTILNYKRDIKEFFGYTDKPIDAVTQREIRNWLTYLSESGYKPGTLLCKLIGLKTFFKYCQEESITDRNPAKSIPLPKLEETIPRYLIPEQIILLKELVSGNLLYRALIEVFLSTGVRNSELVAMKKADINWSERSIHIPRGKGKKSRIVLFNSVGAEHLLVYLNSRLDDLPFVFVHPQGDKPLTKGWINKRLLFCSKQLGFHITPHMFRHTFAVTLAQKGMPLDAIRILLGHDDPNTTQVYARLFGHARKAVYDEWM